MGNENELTPEERGIFLADIDHEYRQDYDKEVYEALLHILTTDIARLDDRVRRAMLRFVSVAHEVARRNPEPAYNEAERECYDSGLLQGIMIGYQAATKHPKDILRKQRGGENAKA